MTTGQLHLCTRDVCLQHHDAMMTVLVCCVHDMAPVSYVWSVSRACVQHAVCVCVCVWVCVCLGALRLLLVALLVAYTGHVAL
jgi:hypothetical protein